MLDTIWQLSGNDLDVDDFVNRFNLDATATYIKGEKSYFGKVYDFSGLTVVVSENLDVSKHLLDIENFIKKNNRAFSFAKEKNYSSCFSMGCTVGESSQFTKSFELSNSHLSLLAENGVSFEFSAYPASDEE